MMTNGKKIANLQAQQATQQAQMDNMSKGILTLCLACGITAISAARANKKARKLEVLINGQPVEAELEKPKKEKKEKKVKSPEAPEAPKPEQLAPEAEEEESAE